MTPGVVRHALRVAAVPEQYPDLVIVRLADQRTVQQWINGPLKHASTLPMRPT